jgi:hypothetical protein
VGLSFAKISVIVTLDLNIALDVLLARTQFLESAEILLLAEDREIEAILPLHGLSTIYYFCRKEMSDAIARQHLNKLMNIVSVREIKEDQLRAALNSDIHDFEDALVAQTAIVVSAEHIITRNTRDFDRSPVPAITPRDFLDRYFA